MGMEPDPYMSNLAQHRVPFNNLLVFLYFILLHIC